MREKYITPILVTELNLSSPPSKRTEDATMCTTLCHVIHASWDQGTQVHRNMSECLGATRWSWGWGSTTWGTRVFQYNYMEWGFHMTFWSCKCDCKARAHLIMAGRPLPLDRPWHGHLSFWGRWSGHEMNGALFHPETFTWLHNNHKVASCMLYA